MHVFRQVFCAKLLVSTIMNQDFQRMALEIYFELILLNEFRKSNFRHVLLFLIIKNEIKEIKQKDTNMLHSNLYISSLYKVA